MVGPRRELVRFLAISSYFVERSSHLRVLGGRKPLPNMGIGMSACLEVGVFFFFGLLFTLFSVSVVQICFFESLSNE